MASPKQWARRSLARIHNDDFSIIAELSRPASSAPLTLSAAAAAAAHYQSGVICFCPSARNNDLTCRSPVWRFLAALKDMERAENWTRVKRRPDRAHESASVNSS